MKRLTLEKLSPSQINKINDLLRICSEKDPIRLSVPVAEANVRLKGERFFFLYEHGQLISMIHLFFPDWTTGELIGFTHPDFRQKHYFRRLLDTALSCAEDLELEQVYLISDGNSPDAIKALDALGLDIEYSEYMLSKQLIPSPAVFVGRHSNGRPCGTAQGHMRHYCQQVRVECQPRHHQHRADRPGLHGRDRGQALQPVPGHLRCEGRG